MEEPTYLHPEFIIPISRSSTEAFKTGEWNNNRPYFQEKCSPCQVACPVGTHIGLALFYASRGQYDDSLSVFLQENPLPGVCGRLCYHPCQNSCNRGTYDEAVNIRALERSASDLGNTQPTMLSDIGKNQSIAVVGSGPAGLAAAYHLSRIGHPVTIFEAENQIGGMLRLAIPEHRLPDTVLERDLARIMSLGIDIQCNVRVDGKKLKSLLTEFNAVFYAPGAHQVRLLEVPGTDHEKVFPGLQFLKAVRSNELDQLAGRVVVIGGGNVSIDVAMTARRLGADHVDIVSLEQRYELPTFEGDYLDAQEENISFHHGWGPVEIGAEGTRISDVKFISCLSVYDEQQNFAPSFDENKAMTLKADWVIPAVGQDSDIGNLNPEIFSKSEVDVPKPDPNTSISLAKGLYIGGDVLGLSGSVAAALGSGKHAALRIHQYLNPSAYEKDLSEYQILDGHGFSIDSFFNPRTHWDPKEVVLFEEIDPLYLHHQEAIPQPRLDPDQRVIGFDEINQGLNDDLTLTEASRCFFCGTCVGCERCFLLCPDVAIIPSKEKTFYFQPQDQYCKGCGTCAAVCNRGVMEFGERT